MFHIPIINKVKVKVKFTLEQATKAQRGSRGIAVLFLQPRRWMVVDGQRHAPAALLPGKTRYPLYRRLCGSQDRPEQVRKILPQPGFDPRTVQSVAAFRALIRYIKYIKRSTHALWFHGFNFIARWSPTCFDHSCGHFQGDDDKNTNIIKMCPVQSAV